MGDLKDLLGAIAVSLIASQITDVCPVLSSRIIRSASRRLGAEQSRYEEEWLAHLSAVPGKLAMIAFACGCFAASLQMLPPFPVQPYKLKQFLRMQVALWWLQILLPIYADKLDDVYRDAPPPEKDESGNVKDVPEDIESYFKAVAAMSLLKVAMDELRKPNSQL